MRRRVVGRIEVLGTALLGVCLALSWLSRSFVYGQGYLERPILLVVGLLLVGFVLYAISVAVVLKQPQRIRLGSILLFAVLFRLAFLPSNPIQEDDVYRYIWDGQTSLQSISPYRYAPDRVMDLEAHPQGVAQADRAALTTLRELASGRGAIIHARINYPDVPTVYPPVAQAVFAATQWVTPWSLQGMRIVLLLFDGVCVLLLLAILKYLHLHPSRILIYAWSPLMLKEVANSAHMEPIAIAAVLLGILLLVKRRWVLASASLALAVASKYYPLVLAPVIAQRLWREGWRVACVGAAAFLAVLVVCFAPFLAGGFRMFEGLGTYARFWEMNSGLFALLQGLASAFIGDGGPVAARALSALLFIGAMVWVCRWRKGSADPMAVTRQMTLLLGIMFLLSPVGNPWYLCWLVPLLCLHPARSWILLTGLVQLYYVGFFIEYHVPEPRASVLWGAVKLVEYGPFYGLVMWDAWVRWRGKRSVPAVDAGAAEHPLAVLRTIRPGRLGVAGVTHVGDPNGR